MLVLFDQATPVPLRPFLKGHTVRTAAQQGWDRLRNVVGRFESDLVNVEVALQGGVQQISARRVITSQELERQLGAIGLNLE